jgi:hypothetical protein
LKRTLGSARGAAGNGGPYRDSSSSGRPPRLPAVRHKGLECRKQAKAQAPRTAEAVPGALTFDGDVRLRWEL